LKTAKNVFKKEKAIKKYQEYEKKSLKSVYFYIKIAMMPILMILMTFYLKFTSQQNVSKDLIENQMITINGPS